MRIGVKLSIGSGIRLHALLTERDSSSFFMVVFHSTLSSLYDASSRTFDLIEGELSVDNANFVLNL